MKLYLKHLNELTHSKAGKIIYTCNIVILCELVNGGMGMDKKMR